MAKRSTLAKKLQVISPDPKRHAEEIFDLTGRVFSGGNEYFGWIKMCRQTYFSRGHYDWKASAIGLLDGRIVTHWGCWRYRMRIGRATVKCGGIGDVATHGEFRCHGLMGATGAAAVGHMRREGYDMSVLFGRHNFYDRFGYVRSWPGHNWTVAVADLPDAKSLGKPRKHRPADVPDMDRAYNRTHAGLTGTAVHPNVRHEGIGDCRVWTRRGKLTGYVIYSYGHDTTMCVTEFAGDTQQVLRVIGQLARKRFCKNVAFSCLHTQSDLCRWLRRGNCADNMYYIRNGGQMITTINLRTALQRISGELGRRLKGSAVEGWRGVLLVADQNDTVGLKISRGRVTVTEPVRSRHAIRGGMHIAQLLIGAQPPDESVEHGAMKVTGDARQLLPVLFPEQHPELGGRDHF